MSRIAAVLLALAVAGCQAVETVHLRRGNNLKPEIDTSVVKPFEFNQRLLICNAYPSEVPLTIKKNSEVMLADEKHPIPYKECRYVSSHVLPHDKLDFVMKETGIEGTFEVGDLPDNDAVLLLVLERRDSTSQLVNFQSFAFPVTADSKDAQLAAIDAVRTTDGGKPAHLKMEDHFTGKEVQTVSKRVEELNFNRVYAIEEGNYDASVLDRTLLRDDSSRLSLDTSREIGLRRGENYVVLRVGDGSPKFPQSIVVFPEVQVKSGTVGRHSAGVALLLAAVLAIAGLL